MSEEHVSDDDRTAVWIRDDGIVFMPLGDDLPSNMRRGWLLPDGTVKYADVLRRVEPNLGTNVASDGFTRGLGLTPELDSPTGMPSEEEIEARIQAEVEKRLADQELRKRAEASVGKKAPVKKQSRKRGKQSKQAANIEDDPFA